MCLRVQNGSNLWNRGRGHFRSKPTLRPRLRAAGQPGGQRAARRGAVAPVRRSQSAPGFNTAINKPARCLVPAGRGRARGRRTRAGESPPAPPLLLRHRARAGGGGRSRRDPPTASRGLAPPRGDTDGFLGPAGRRRGWARAVGAGPGTPHLSRFMFRLHLFKRQPPLPRTPSHPTQPSPVQ